MSALAFFASAAASFQPAPYTPAAHASSSRPPTRTQSRSHDSLAVPPPGMDPQPSDPNVLFIHPPFTTFPNSHQHSDGLTYSLMAENPEWFLDAHDFVTHPDGNTNLIPYPPHLEPPRGWCPAKKRDLKDRGAEGWPEGEEPRLRCTFCRRTYAGVNAKSMWRRHVFEKHKIAMSNRRDGNIDRPRGRGSGSTYLSALFDHTSINIALEENRHTVSKSRDEAHDSLVTMVVVPQTAPEIMSHKSRFRTAKPVSQTSKRGRDRETKKDEEECLPTPLPSQPSHPDPSEHSDSESETEPPVPVTTASPPLTPQADTSSDPPNLFSSNSDALAANSPALLRPVIPESPYNPLQTPSFRHSPPRLPSEQPWRFPSPSHPLHSNTRDISLTMVSRPLASPIKGLLEASPMTMLAMNSSPTSSPARTLSQSLGFETPARSKIFFPRTMHKPQFMKSQMSSPLTSATKQYRGSKQRLSGSSPFRKPIATPHKKHLSDYSDSWFAEGSLASSSSNLTATTNSDLFSIYDSWPTIGGVGTISPVRLPKAPLESESPILRSGSLSTIASLGIGLLEPFGFAEEDPTNQLDVDLNLPFPELEDEPRFTGKRPALLANVDTSAEVTPPVKKRRMSQDNPNT